jgi:hypothetical protein
MGTVWLETPLADAKISPRPGVLAVAISWFKGDPVGSAARFTMLPLPLGLTACQENGPTVAVMSVFPFMAVAW